MANFHRTESLLTIGNDVVDLSADEPALHRRFTTRVFTDYERVRIGADRGKLWLYWAAKEAAYKALKRNHPDLCFIPIRFEFDEIINVVKFGNYSVYCKTIVTSNYVLVNCSNQRDVFLSGALRSWVHEVGDADVGIGGDIDMRSPSRVVRALALKNIAQRLGVSEAQLSIKSSSDAAMGSVPLLQLRGAQSEHLLSFSHHGRYVAASFIETSASIPVTSST